MWISPERKALKWFLTRIRRICREGECPFSSYIRLISAEDRLACSWERFDFAMLLYKWNSKSNIKPHQQVQSAPSSLPPLANPALSLENLTATTRTPAGWLSTAAAASVMLTWLVLLTQPQGLDYGNQCTHNFVLLKAVGTQVSGEYEICSITHF